MTPPNDTDGQPYSRDRHVDKPGIVGARWWHDSLADQAAQIARRDAIRNILIAGGVIAGFGAMLAMCIKGASSSSSGLSSDESEQRKTSLDIQKDYGWNFGAIGEALVFDGVTTKPFQPGALSSLAVDAAPQQREHIPFFQSTLFDSPDAVPRSISSLPAEERDGFKTLSTSVLPIQTPAMDAAYARGKSLASLFGGLTFGPADAHAAVVVDLPGPEAVAFAAGASNAFDLVFLFDNWPHPRGVVRAQETLSAAAYYQPLFRTSRASTTFRKRPPMFVLDRRRIVTYADDATQFDNRYVAKLPSPASTMKNLGIQHVLYVVPKRGDTSQELDDLNDDFVAYSKAGLDVKALSLDLFGAEVQPPNQSTPDAGANALDTGGVFYGGSSTSHHAFFVDYPWAKPAKAATARPPNPGTSYTPTPRTSSYSSGTSSTSSTRTRPTNFGTVPVVVAVGTGVILGARYSRSGSWNRSSGGWGG